MNLDAMNPASTILVAGIGNIFLGDDGFGCEVAQQMSRHPLPENVVVRDFGIGSYDLAYAIMDGHLATILVDAVPRGHAPGTLFLIEPDLENLGAAQVPDGHSMTPVSVLQLVRSLGGEPRGLWIVGCEPAPLECEDGQMGLSENVQAAIAPALEMIDKLIHDLLSKSESPTPLPFAEATER